MKTKRFASLLLTTNLVLALSLVSGSTFEAHTAEAVSKIDIQKAKEFFAQGTKLFEQGKYVEASEAFLHSYDLSNNALLLYNVARSYEEAKNLAEAKNYYRLYLAKAPDAQNVDEVESRLEEINKVLATLVYPIEIRAKSKKPVTIYVDKRDGSPTCQAPCSVELREGSHFLYASDGRESREVAFLVKTTDNSTVIVDFSSPSGIPVGSVELKVDNPKLIQSTKINDLIGKSGETFFYDISVGKHDITIETPNLLWSGVVEVENDRTTDVTLMLEEMDNISRASSNWKTILSSSLLGAGLTSIAVAGYLGHLTEETRELLTSNYTRAPDVQNTIVAHGRELKLATNILYGVGGGLTGIGLGFLIWKLFDKTVQNSNLIFSPKD